MPSSDFNTLSTASSLLRQYIITLTSDTASAGADAFVAPIPARGSHFSIVRFHTVTGYAASSRFAAIPLPIVPNPR
jgi:hypothetical protein